MDSSIELARRLLVSGEYPGALRLANQAFEQAKDRRDSSSQADAALLSGKIHFRLGHYTQARERAQLAMDLAAGDRLLEARAWILFGNVFAETHSLAEAESCFLKAADSAREVGATEELASAFHNLACAVYLPRGQFALALCADQDSLRHARSKDLAHFIPYPLISMTWAYRLSGQFACAEEALAELEQRAAPGSHAQAHATWLSGCLALDEGDLEEAIARLERARYLSGSLGDQGLVSIVQADLSHCWRLKGDLPGALAWANEAVKSAQRVEYAHFFGRALILRARAAWLLGSAGPAWQDLRQAREVLEPLEARYDLAELALVRAYFSAQQCLPSAQEDWETAARQIIEGGFYALIVRERELAYPLIAARLERCKRSSDDPTARSMLEALQRAPAQPLRVITFGGLAVWQGKRLLPEKNLRQRRSGELLILLMLAPAHTLSFDQVAEELWPEKDPQAIQPLFHQATSTLRRILEPDLPGNFPSQYLEVKEGRISLLLAPGASFDLAALDAAIRQEQWEAAAGLVRGEFLPEFLYNTWTVIPRQQAGLLAQQALIGLARQRFDQGRYTEVLDLCQRILTIEHWSEPAVQLGMCACQRMGDKTMALRLYRQLEKALQEELDIPPGPELQALARQILQDSDQ